MLDSVHAICGSMVEVFIPSQLRHILNAHSISTSKNKRFLEGEIVVVMQTPVFECNLWFNS